MSNQYTQEEVTDRVRRILSMSRGLRQGVINEFYDMANGGDAYGIRAEYYSDKPNRFFTEVLEGIAASNGGRR